MAKYRVETDNGAYEVETDEPTPAPDNTAANFEFERGPNYPNSRMTDPSIDDAMMLQGVGGLAKAAPKAALSLTGKLLNGLEATKNIVPTIGDLANEQFLKSVGGSAAQIGKYGPEKAREVAAAGRAAGMEDLFSTARGRKEGLKNLQETSGQNIGQLRMEAGAPSPDSSLIDQIKAKIGDRYSSGVGSSQASNYRNALDDVAKLKSNASYNDIAGKATEMNAEAAGKGIALPDTAATEVTKNLSNINDQGIAQSLGSDKAQQYLENLKTNSQAHALEQFAGQGERKTITQKHGLAHSLIDAMADKGGFRSSSKGLNSLYEGLNAPIGNVGTPMAKIGAANVMERLKSSPQSFGRYAGPLQQAAQQGGNQGVAAMHYVLSTTDPSYNEMMQSAENNNQP